ncbi:MAG: CCA tRNA nucleotidyltransferase [Paludibacteraceae bacterium]|nr:CCA tRNA nucleotidyltransferase [Paludibacteraceae bacterium]
MTIADKKIDSPILRLIGEEADKLQLDCYVIGGWVRDLILHRESNDIDIVVIKQSTPSAGSLSDTPLKTADSTAPLRSGIGILLAEAVAKRLGKHAHLSVFRTYGTAQVKQHDIELEFVGARKESYQHDSRNPIVEDGTLEEDQNRRDFTINALAICLNKDRYGELIDPFGGIKDMNEGTIRTPLDPDITFSDDPLRMMRAIRFACQLGFYLDPKTFDAIERNRERIQIITRERIDDELNKIMLSRRPSVGWLLLDKTGLLPLIFPELAALKGIDTKEGRGHKDVFLHTLQVVDNISMKSDKLWLRWAALLHDIGKPKTKAWDTTAGWTFRNHNYVGAKMIPHIFKAMKLPQNEKMEYVRKLVDLHMRPINLIEDTVTDSAVRRLLFEAGDDIEDLMLLCDADITSRNEAKVQRFHKNYQLVRQKMVELEERDRIRNFQPPVRGEEIMALLNLPPCSTVGELKNAIKEAILDGIIPNDYNEAKEYLFSLAKERGLL